jgi:hypothetical protein
MPPGPAHGRREGAVIEALRATRPKPLSNEQVLYCVGVIRLVAFTTAQVYKALRTSAPAFLHNSIKVRLRCISLRSFGEWRINS